MRCPLRIAGVCEATFTPATITLVPPRRVREVLRAGHSQIGQQRIEEAHDVATGIHPQHLELGPHDLGVGVVLERVLGRDRVGERELIALARHLQRSSPGTGGRAGQAQARRIAPAWASASVTGRDTVVRRMKSATSPKRRSARARTIERISASDDPVHVLERQPDPEHGDRLHARAGLSRRRHLLDDVVGVALVDVERRGSGCRGAGRPRGSARRGYMPGSWVSRPAYRCAG